MNGIGWVCDECGHKEVVDSLAAFAKRTEEMPPDGWYLLGLSGGQPSVGRWMWSCCSLDCLLSLAAKAVVA